MFYAVHHFEPRSPEAGARRFQEEAFLNHWPSDHYVPVASVNAEHLDQVYRLSQNMAFESWTQRELVVSAQLVARSTSVGDVIVDPRGQAWGVASIGFRAIVRRKVEG